MHVVCVSVYTEAMTEMDMNQRKQFTRSELYGHWLRKRVQARLAAARKFRPLETLGTDQATADRRTLELVMSVYGHKSLTDADKGSVEFACDLLTKSLDEGEREAIVFLLETSNAPEMLSQWPSLKRWTLFASMSPGCTCFKHTPTSKLWEAFEKMHKCKVTEEDITNALVKAIYTDFCKVFELACQHVIAVMPHVDRGCGCSI